MFERFSEAARQAVFWARHAVSALGGRAIEPEHLLLGLVRARGIACETLRAAGVQVTAVRAGSGR
jgi:hypothetical protein